VEAADEIYPASAQRYRGNNCAQHFNPSPKPFVVRALQLTEFVSAPQQPQASKQYPNVCFWHLADIETALSHVRFRR
jgi:hypothetical protein